LETQVNQLDKNGNPVFRGTIWMAIGKKFAMVLRIFLNEAG
jgi:hypothetical protein